MLSVVGGGTPGCRRCCRLLAATAAAARRSGSQQSPAHLLSVCQFERRTHIHHLSLCPRPCRRNMFGSSMFVYDLATDVTAEVHEARGDSAVTCLHLDPFGRIWTGHRSGCMK